jgi:ATP-dependent Clp protease ATP-binding subunit ClpA
MADKYLPNLYNPDKCLDILDTTCSKKVLENKDNVITEQDIYDVISSKINLINLNDNNLIKVEQDLKVKYNEQMIKNIINVIKSKDINKYMFLNGADSNTKLKIIKYIANNLNINLINIDCLEYNDEYSINKLLNNNNLYNQIVEKPYSFIVFNNYNDASKILHNIIDTMINKGYITNNNNELTYLNNAIVFILNNSETNMIGFNSENNLLFAS